MTDKEKEYTGYIDEHCGNVIKVWRNVHEKVNQVTGLDDYEWHSINERILRHDESKRTSSEFDGYRLNFYPEEAEIKSQNLFDYAWNHHQNKNDHHWEYWVIASLPESKPIPMPFVCVVEMLCDWGAMSLKFKDVPSDFYKAKKDRMILHGKTMKHIEEIIGCFDEAVKELSELGKIK